MKLLLTQLVIVILLNFIGVIISRKFDPTIQLVPIIIFAIVSVLIAYCVGIIDEKLNSPLVSINVNKGSREMLIRIKSSRALETLAIDLPVLGKVINIHDNNSLADARTSKRVVGEETNLSQNNVEFLIEKLKGNAPLEYKVLFEPITIGISVTGTDRYKISYSWYYNGNLRYKTKWISIESGREVEQPNIIVKGVTIHKRALTPEEIKQRYQQGIRTRNVE